MNYLAIVNFQRIIFSIIFILSGLYLILFLLKEILMLFIPRKQSFDLTNFLKEIKYSQPQEIKYLQPADVITKENKYIKPEVITKVITKEIKKENIKTPTESPSVKKIKRKERKSRKRNNI